MTTIQMISLTPALVRQRLKLAAVSPVLMALYRDEQLTLDQLMTFTLAYDTLHGFTRTQGKRQPLPAKQAKALAKAEKQRDALAEAEELTEEEADRLEALETEIDGLRDAQLAWSERQKRNAGAIIGIWHGGILAIERGLIRASDKQARKLAEAENDPPALPAAFGLSAKLADDLTTHRTAALRALLADRPDMVLVP